MATKSSGKTQITNTSDQAYALPDGTHIPAGESVVVTNEVWETAEQNETVQAWVESGALETEAADTSAEDAAAEEEKARKEEERQKAEEEKGRQAAKRTEQGSGSRQRKTSED